MSRGKSREGTPTPRGGSQAPASRGSSSGQRRRGAGGGGQDETPVKRGGTLVPKSQNPRNPLRDTHVPFKFSASELEALGLMGSPKHDRLSKAFQALADLVRWREVADETLGKAIVNEERIKLLVDATDDLLSLTNELRAKLNRNSEVVASLILADRDRGIEHPSAESHATFGKDFWEKFHIEENKKKPDQTEAPESAKVQMHLVPSLGREPYFKCSVCGYCKKAPYGTSEYSSQYSAEYCPSCSEMKTGSLVPGPVKLKCGQCGFEENYTGQLHDVICPNCFVVAEWPGKEAAKVSFEETMPPKDLTSKGDIVGGWPFEPEEIDHYFENFSKIPTHGWKPLYDKQDKYYYLKNLNAIKRMEVRRVASDNGFLWKPKEEIRDDRADRPFTTEELEHYVRAYHLVGPGPSLLSAGMPEDYKRADLAALNGPGRAAVRSKARNAGVLWDPTRKGQALPTFGYEKVFVTVGSNGSGSNEEAKRVDDEFLWFETGRNLKVRAIAEYDPAETIDISWEHVHMMVDKFQESLIKKYAPSTPDPVNRFESNPYLLMFKSSFMGSDFEIIGDPRKGSLVMNFCGLSYITDQEDMVPKIYALCKKLEAAEMHKDDLRRYEHFKAGELAWYTKVANWWRKHVLRKP